MAERSKENATDLLMFGRELRCVIGRRRWRPTAVRPSDGLVVSCSLLGSDGSSLPPWASSQATWGTLRQSLKSLSVEFAVLSDKAAQQV